MINLNELNLEQLFKSCHTRLEKLFTHYIAEIPAPELKAATEYTLLNGGKRLRPLLAYATAAIFNGSWENSDIAAGAIEIMHTYSLIHDDLPCMDDAKLRRGKLTCHKVFGEGIAVLAGDGLQTLAMQLITQHPATLSATNRAKMIRVLSKAAGPFGMVAGQAIDINLPENETISTDLLLEMYRLKTGLLFSASIELGRLSAEDDDELHQAALHEFGRKIGLAFQIQDDVLDIEAETETLGKQQGIDNINHKMTFPKRYGLKAAKEKVSELYKEALTAIDFFGARALLLRDLTGYLLERKM